MSDPIEKRNEEGGYGALTVASKELVRAVFDAQGATDWLDPAASATLTAWALAVLALNQVPVNLLGGSR